jgi:integrase/recombinase XerC
VDSHYQARTEQIVLKQHGSSFRLEGKPKRLVESANNFLSAIEARGMSINTVRSYGYDLVYFLRWFPNLKKTFKRVEHKDFLEYIKYQRNENAAPTSINRRLISADMFYRFCFNRALPRSREVSYPASYYRTIGYDRARGIFPIRRSLKRTLRVNEQKRVVQGLEPWEVAEFFKKVQKHRDMAMVLCMLMLGLRRCEILNLKMSGVDLSERKLRVVGKGNRERVLPLPSPIINAMIRYLKFERPEDSEEFFFVVLQGERRGKKFKPAGLDGFFRYKRKVSNILRANPHRFRHTFGRDMATYGVELPVLQRMMGHADAKTTLRYINLRMSDVAAEYNKIQEKLKDRYGRH